MPCRGQHNTTQHFSEPHCTRPPHSTSLNKLLIKLRSINTHFVLYILRMKCPPQCMIDKYQMCRYTMLIDKIRSKHTDIHTHMDTDKHTHGHTQTRTHTHAHMQVMSRATRPLHASCPMCIEQCYHDNNNSITQEMIQLMKCIQK